MIGAFFSENIVGQTIVGYLLMFAVPLALPVLFIKLVGIQGLRHLFSYEPRQTVIHQLDPRLKVVYPSLIGILTVFLNWNFVYALVAFTLIPWFLLRTSRSRLRVVITMIGVPALGMVWSQGLFHVDSTGNDLLYRFPPTLSWLGTPGLSAAGLLYGAQQAGRTMAAVSASLMLLFTTKPSEIIWAFYKFRLPAAAGLAFTAALRFLPQLLERMTVLLQVMQVRGYDLSSPRWWQLRAWPGYIARVFGCIPTVTVPLLIGSLRATVVMAMVADARAFGAQPERSTLREHAPTSADGIALGVLVLLCLAVLALVLFHVGESAGVMIEPRTIVQAVFFDANGVIYYRKERWRRLRAFLQAHSEAGNVPDDLRRGVKEIRNRAFRGAVSRDTLYDAVLDTYGIVSPALRAEGRQIQADDDADITLYEGIITTLPALRARGFRLGIITDSAASSVEKQRWMRGQGLHLEWDAFADSAEVGVRKPDARMYQTALDQAGVRAESAVFVGHDAEELAGARAVGMHTVAFNHDGAAPGTVVIARFDALLELPLLRRCE